MLALTVFRKHAAVSILVAFSLYHSIGLVRSSTLAYLKGVNSDPTSPLEKRLEPLKIRLSSYGYKKVGYITDTPVDISSLHTAPDWAMEYLRTQYILAPIMVEDLPTGPYVVGIFRNSSSLEDVVADLGLSVVVDYGNGVFLLSRNQK
jgi:hypothetical protein